MHVQISDWPKTCEFDFGDFRLFYRRSHFRQRRDFLLIMTIVVLAHVLVYSTVLCTFAATQGASTCAQINKIFSKSAKANYLSQPACQCFLDSTSPYEIGKGHRRESWVGCARQNMPHVFNALNALNESTVSKLWIWDSLINIVPPNMFSQIRPMALSIQRSGVSVFRPNAFSKVGPNLRVLELRHNLLKELDPSVFQQLYHLSILDLAENKISKLERGQLDSFTELKTLVISDNHLNRIVDHAFKNLTNLKVLNLANNQLSTLTSETFFGLENLEELYLQNNNFISIDPKAMAHLQNLKILNLGNNHLSNIKLYGLKNLEKLILINNGIKSMKNVTLEGLSNLKVLSLDRNMISHIAEGDLTSLQGCKRLDSLSMVFNRLRSIELNAFAPVSSLRTLSLQNNELTSLSQVFGEETISFLHPLSKLKQLYLSYNSISELKNADFASLFSLRVLELDDNLIQKIDQEALKNLPLSHLYLANNRLHHLPKGVFAETIGTLEVVDLSGNPWQCISNEEWLSHWVEEMGDRILHRNLMGCMKPKEISETHSSIIAILASVLAVISIFILFAIAFLYFEDGRRIKRAPSDLLHLISNTDEIKQPLCDGENQVRLPTSGSGKKRVRFDGV